MQPELAGAHRVHLLARCKQLRLRLRLRLGHVPPLLASRLCCTKALELGR